jgi:hemerythrin-like domain-containing protein
MTSTEILRVEHRAIDVVLECLLRMGQQAEQSGQLDTASATPAIEFLTRFVEARHHAKEERAFFEVLVAKGWPRNEGLIAVMLADHTEGRALLRKMIIASDETARGIANRATAFGAAAEGYANLLRGHMRRENLILFPRADRVLSGEDHTAILAAFQQADAQQECGGANGCVIDQARKLAERLKVPAAALSAIDCSCTRS